jgi:dUTP pyrophosphatase
MQTLKIKVKTKEHSQLPVYSTEGAAGADVKAFISENIVIGPQEIKLIPTGIFLEIPFGYEVQVRPRSGLALKNGVTVLNTPGTIDCDYRGELKVILINHSQTPFVVENGMRIAQIVVQPMIKGQFELAEEELVETARGSQGFGHTGV